MAALLAGAWAAGAWAAGPPAHARDRVSVTAPRVAPAGPGLSSLSTAPSALNLAFAADRHDYVLQCKSGQTVTVTGSATAGTVVRARQYGPGAGAPARLAGAFTYTFTPPATSTVRFDVTAAAAPTRDLATYRIRCLPTGFPTLTTTTAGTPQSAFYVVTHASWDVVLNAEGTPVWWMDQAPSGPVDAKIIDGRIVTTVPGGDYVFRDWDGTPVRTVHHGFDHHDLQRFPDGTLMGFQYYDSARGLTEEARFVKLDAAGDDVWSWRTEDHLGPSESSPAAFKLTWGHINSVEPDGTTRFLWGARNLDALYDVDLASGEVVWKLGGTTTPQSLTISDGQRDLTEAEVLNLLRGPHDARFLPDGTVTVMDNGSSGLARRPRILRFSLDLPNRRATIVQTVTDPRAGYSFGLGSARRTSGGNWVVHWGGGNSFITELGPTGAPVVTISGISTYRAVPVEPGEIDEDAMRAGMDARAGTPAAVTGTVTEAGSGTPVPYAGIALFRADDLTFARGAVADGDGNFHAAAPPGTYFAYVLDSSGGHTSTFHGPPTPVTVSAGHPADARVVMAPTRGAISGTVRDESSGAPIAGAWAVALDAASGEPLAAAAADGAGRYTLGSLAVRSYKTVYLDAAAAHASRFFAGTSDPAAATPLVVAAGGTTGADIGLPAQATTPGAAALTGAVTESGTDRPIAGAVVLALRASDLTLAGTTRTSANGGYTLNVAPGAYKLAFLDPSGAHRMEWHAGPPSSGLASATAVTAPGATNAQLDATTGSIGGTVRDDGTGAALPGLWVIAIGPDGVVGGAITAADGRYAIPNLRPGTYRVAFIDPTGARALAYWPDSPDFAGAGAVPITAGAQATVDADR